MFNNNFQSAQIKESGSRFSDDYYWCSLIQLHLYTFSVKPVSAVMTIPIQVFLKYINFMYLNVLIESRTQFVLASLDSAKQLIKKCQVAESVTYHQAVKT